jgi:hypothetical protein
VLKRVALLLVVCKFLWIPPFAACYAESDALQARLIAPIHDYSLTAPNFAEALIQVASQFQIPIGIEWVNTPAARTPLTLNWKDTTVQQIFAAITTTQPGYELSVHDGIVHVFSMKVAPSQNFVHLKIERFEAHHQSVRLAERRLQGLVNLKVAPPKPTGEGRGESFAANTDESMVDLQFQDVTVEAILDSLATASSKKIWVVTFVDSFIPTETGFRRTLTLWNNSPFPDDQQPVWDTFHWGDSIPTSGLEQK